MMHDGELVGDEQPGGLCLQAIPSGKGGDGQANNRGASSMNRISMSERVQRESSHMKAEADIYSTLFGLRQ